MLTEENTCVNAPAASVRALPRPWATPPRKSSATATLRVPSTRQRQKPQARSPMFQCWLAALLSPLSNTRVRVKAAPSGASAGIWEPAMVPW